MIRICHKYFVASKTVVSKITFDTYAKSKEEVNTMERIPVESNNLASVGYDSVTSTLEIEFRSGRIYQYFAVSQEIYDGLMNAASKGSYFDHNIKKGGYSYTKVG